MTLAERLEVLARHPSAIPSFLLSWLRSRRSPDEPPPRYRALWKEVHRRAPKIILEIGVWRGVTGRRLIEEAVRFGDRVEYWGFDLFAEGMTTSLLAHEAALRPLALDEVRQRLQIDGATVHLVAGNTNTTLAQAHVPPVDLVFVDGGHSYETVKSDWLNVQRFLHDDSVVFFDDYNNHEAEVHANFGVKRLVDEIDPALWTVELLHPIDVFVHPWGILRSRFARVTKRRARS